MLQTCRARSNGQKIYQTNLIKKSAFHRIWYFCALFDKFVYVTKIVLSVLKRSQWKMWWIISCIFKEENVTNLSRLNIMKKTTQRPRYSIGRSISFSCLALVALFFFLYYLKQQN